MSIETNLNESPFFDDFNETKNFHRVLFRPGFAVQARELTQIQTILQNQIERFAGAVYVDGTVVNGCDTTAETWKYVKLRDKDANNRSLLLVDFFNNGVIANSTVTGESTGVTAKLLDVADGSESGTPNFLTAFVSYTNSGANNSTKSFANNETLIFRNSVGGSFIVAANTITQAQGGACGDGVGANVSKGIVYHKGNFIRVDQQSKAIIKYNTTDSIRIGMETSESIIDSNQDSSLLDNASGATNFSAPGASRLKLTPKLATRPADDTGTANTVGFIPLLDLQDGNVIRKNDTVYSGIAEELATRTYEESGNYSLNPFQIATEEHLRTDNNGGVYRSTESGDANKLVVEISPSVGYVGGYRIETTNKIRKTIDKATTFETRSNVQIGQAFGQYVIADDLVGNWDFKGLVTVDLYDTPQTRISRRKFSSEDATLLGNKIGTATLRGIQYHSGLRGTQQAQYRIYGFNVQMTSGSFEEDVKSLHIASSGADDAFADCVLVNNKAKTEDLTLNKMIFPVQSTGTKTLVTNETSYVTRHFSDVTIDTAGAATFNLPTSEMSGGTNVNDTTGSPISLVGENDFIVVANEDVTVDLALTTSVNVTHDVSASNTVVLTTTGDFSSKAIEVGDYVTVDSGITTAMRVLTIGTTTMSVHVNSGSSTDTTISSGANIDKVYKAGHVFDMSSSASHIDADTNSIELTLAKGTFGSSFSARVYYDIKRNEAKEEAKVVHKSKYVHIDTSAHSAGIAGPWHLGVSDAYKLEAVYVGDEGSAVTNEMGNYITAFALETGQQNSFYGGSKIRKRALPSLDLTGKDLLFKFSYFERNRSAGVGFLSVDSYPVNDAPADAAAAAASIFTAEIPTFRSPGIFPEPSQEIDLRDSIDFRPALAKTVTPHATGSSASAPTNPAAPTVFDIDSTFGAYVPTPDKNFQCDVQAYLPRIDTVTLRPNGVFDILKGTPAINPSVPSEAESTSMTIGSITIPPYPSLSQTSATFFDKFKYQVNQVNEDNRRYTMRDIRLLDAQHQSTMRQVEINRIDIEGLKNTSLRPDDPVTAPEPPKEVVISNPPPSQSVVNSLQARDFISDAAPLRPIAVLDDVDLKVTSTTNSIVNTGGTRLEPVHGSKVIAQQNFATARAPISKKTTSPVKTYNGTMELSHSNCRIKQEIIPGLSAASTTSQVQVDYGSSFFANALDFFYPQYNTVTVTNPVVTKLIEEYKQAGADYSGLAEASLVPGGTNDYFIKKHSAITVKCAGLKPSTKVYARFDGRDVGSYVVRITRTGSSVVSHGTGSQLITEADGTLEFKFLLPNDATMKFRGLKHLLEVSDVKPPVKHGISSGKEGSTTRCGQYYFAASNQSGGYSYKDVNKLTSNITLNELSADKTQTAVSTTLITEELPDYISQVFQIPANNVDGIFCNAITLFFSKKPSDATSSVLVQIRECDDNGPTDVLLGQSGIVVNSAISTTHTTVHNSPTNFSFYKAPFLESGKKYAFTIIPSEAGSDYEVFTMVQGQPDLSTNKSAYITPGVGKLYTSATGNVWAEAKNEYLKFRLQRKNYQVVVDGNDYESSFILSNGDTEFLNVNSVSPFGEPTATTGFQTDEVVRGQSLLTINQGTTALAVGDILHSKVAKNTTVANHPRAWANGVIRKVVDNTNGAYIVSVDAFGDFPTDANSNTENKIYRGAADIGTATAFTANTVTGKVSFFNHHYGRLRLLDSTGTTATNAGFRGNDATRDWVKSQDTATSAFITSVADPLIDKINLTTPYFSPSKTTIDWGIKTTSTAGTTATTFTPVVGDTSIELSTKQAKLFSKSNRTDKSILLKATMTTTDASVAPVVSLNDISAEIELQRINATDDNEQLVQGDASSRYLTLQLPASRPNGDAAERLNVWVKAYVPQEGGMSVYVRAKNDNDSVSLEDKPFTKLERYFTSPKSSSTLGDKSDHIRQMFRLPKSSNDNYLDAITTAFGSGGAAAQKQVVVASGTGIVAGMSVSGTGVADNAKVVTVSGNTITVDINFTAQVSGNLSFSNDDALKEMFLAPRAIKYRSSTGAVHQGIDQMQFKIVLTRPDGTGRDYTPEIHALVATTTKVPVA